MGHSMDESGARVLRYVAAALVFISAGVHLWWGLPRFLVYARPQTLAFYVESGGYPIRGPSCSSG